MSDANQESTIVCNSGPLIALISIDSLYILNKLYRRIFIPDAVYKELTFSEELVGAREIANETWIETTILKQCPHRHLRSELGVGEAEVVSLAMELNATKMLIDEKKGRRIAKLVYGLSIIGTGGLLLLAKQNGFIKSVKPLLEQMRTNGYYLSDRLISRIVKEAGE